MDDANAVAQTFHDIGFDTHKLTDANAKGGKLSYMEMVETIQAFVEANKKEEGKFPELN